MTKRRVVVAYLLAQGFRSAGGTKHEKFIKGKTTVMLKRHCEIPDETFAKIRKQAQATAKSR